MSESLTNSGPDLSLRSVRLVLIITFMLGVSAVFVTEVAIRHDPFVLKTHYELMSALGLAGVHLIAGSMGGYIACIRGGRKRIGHGVAVAIALMWLSVIVWILGTLLCNLRLWSGHG